MLFVIFENCLNTNPQKSRHQSPRQMSCDIITAHYFSNPWYCTVKLFAKNDTKAKMEIPQNLQNPATIYITVIFSQKLSESML